MSTERMLSEWVDAAGGFLRTAGWLDSAATLSALGDALAGCSNAQLAFVTAAEPYISGVAAVPDVTWFLCTDTMVLLFRCADAGTIQITIPAPLQECFLPDALTVDPSSSPMVTLIGEVVGQVLNNTGSPVTAFIQGVRSSRRVEQNAPPGG